MNDSDTRPPAEATPPASVVAEAAAAPEAPPASLAPPGEAMVEGEEEAPRGVRVMAVVRWLLVVLMAGVAGGSIYHYAWGSPTHADKRYQCPMHPSIIQDQPGDCPICGMSLVLVTGGKVKPAVRNTHAAPAQASPAKPDPAVTIYECPMHPDQTSKDPKAKCPDCGMNLELQKPKAEGAVAVPEGAHPVPGLVPIDLSPERIQLIGMRTARVVRRSLGSEIRTVGYVTASERGLAVVATRFSGWIEQLFVNQTGDRVSRGQVLATIYSQELLTVQQDLLNALRWAGSAAKEGADERQLSASLGVNARRRLELLGVSSTEIDEVVRTGKPIRALRIRSPVSGHITLKSAFPGQYVQPGMALFEVADLSTVWVQAEVYENEAGRVRVGQPVKLELTAFPGRTLEDKIAFVYPTIDPATRTLRIRVVLKNPNLELKPGMYAAVRIEVASTQDLVVPREGIVDTGDFQYAFVVRGGGRFEPRRVKLGAHSDDAIQVLSGLAEGETIVTTGNFLVDSESRLRFTIEGAGEKQSPLGAAPPAPAPAAGHTGHGR